MKTVYKYALEPEMKLPKGAKILAAALQNDAIYLWAEVESEHPMEDRFFHAYGTGFNLPENAKIEYISTVFLPTGLVWHVYELV